MGLPDCPNPDMDCSSQHDPRGFSVALKCDCPNRWESWLRPSNDSSAKHFWNFGAEAVDLDNKTTDTVATQVAALTYQSQLTASTAANLIQRTAEQQFGHLATQKNLMHENMHQIIAQINALSFNQSNAGQGRLGVFDSGHRGCGCGRRKQGGAHTAFDGGQFGGGFAPATGGFAPGPTAAAVPYKSMTQGRAPPGFYAPVGTRQGGQMQYHLPPGGI
jgi:hypothetical protein